jgi:hypothetical protein
MYCTFEQKPSLSTFQRTEDCIMSVCPISQDPHLALTRCSPSKSHHDVLGTKNDQRRCCLRRFWMRNAGWLPPRYLRSIDLQYRDPWKQRKYTNHSTFAPIHRVRSDEALDAKVTGPYSASCSDCGVSTPKTRALKSHGYLNRWRNDLLTRLREWKLIT